MRQRNAFLAAFLLLGLTAYGQHPTIAQQATPPKENKGIQATVKQAVDLGPEIDGMSGRQLRMRTLTIEPSGHIGLHSHKDRPAVLYVLKGTDTVIAEDGTQKVLRPGDTASSNKNTTHWHRNDGKEPVVLILVDVFNTASPSR
jgi:quercetin dioxygenase-like cupin family protein